MMEDNYTVLPFPRARRLITDIGWLSRQRNAIHGLLEIDVTRPRHLIHAHRKRTGEKLSFTAYLAACTGRAVESNRHLHAYRDWLGRLVLFDNVDIATMIEIERHGKRFPIGHIIRAADKKSFRQIHAEIREVQAKPVEDQEAGRLFAFRRLPGFLRRFLLWLLERDPQRVKRLKGTVLLTAVGMFGQGGGWGIGLPSHTLGITAGGISEKPAIVEGCIEPREYLNVTLSFDHDIVDGAPAARFAQRFRELVEGGDALRDI